jgi:hypothetical protein
MKEAEKPKEKELKSESIDDTIPSTKEDVNVVSIQEK